MGSRKLLAKRKIRQVLHRLFAQVVVDAEDVVLGKRLVQHVIELARRDQIAAEGLFDDHAGILGSISDSAESLHHHRKHRAEESPGSASAIARRPAWPQLCVGLVVVVVAVDVTHQLAELLEGRLIHAAAKLRNAVAGALAQLFNRPAGLGDADDRHIQEPCLIMLCSEGKIFLWARSPVAPKNTKASERVEFMRSSYEDGENFQMTRYGKLVRIRSRSHHRNSVIARLP